MALSAWQASCVFETSNPVSYFVRIMDSGVACKDNPLMRIACTGYTLGVAYKSRVVYNGDSVSGYLCKPRMT